MKSKLTVKDKFGYSTTLGVIREQSDGTYSLHDRRGYSLGTVTEKGLAKIMVENLKGKEPWIPRKK